MPAFDHTKHVCFDPHLVILGAGASLAALPDGDANGRRLPLMKDFVEVVGLSGRLETAGVEWRGRNFEEVFSALYARPDAAELAETVESLIYDYFASLVLPDRVTLYDELVLSLRAKDVVATFNWDPFLLQAFRRNLAVRRMPRVLFLHGNVGVGVCVEHQRKGLKGTQCDECGEPLKPVRLLYPVTEKNYQADAFICGLFRI